MHLYRSQFASPCDEETLTLVEKGRTTIITPATPTEIREEIGYWRKANQIHGWFVDHVQSGIDDCRDYYVERDQLRELKQSVEDVLLTAKLIPGKIPAGATLDSSGDTEHFEDGLVIANPQVAISRLPVRRGVFFGSYVYDEAYLQALRQTLSILEAALASPPEMEFTYRSSW